MTIVPENSGKGVVPTRNVYLLMELVDRVKGRGFGLPGMGTFYGPSGWGKSSAVIHCALSSHRSYYVQMKSLWSRKSLLEMILAEMSIVPARTMPPMLEQIGKQLAQSGRPLIIDEADYIVKKGMIEVVRDIYEVSQGTVILVGEENLPGHLEAIERVHGRMLDWVAAQPADMDDAKMFAGQLCPGVVVADDLLERFVEAARGSARYLCNNLNRLAEFCRLQNRSEIAAQDYSAPLFTGKAPEGRKL
ncbi:MAG: ATP-binding protein [Desulfovibrio sp.]|jgi:hypothetical protein|nr:ATP-binding protein [Desulfovibrio sp.]